MTSALIVDDEPLLAAYLSQLLLAQWPTLELLPPATHAEEALERLQVQTPDIAFLDIHMPGESGLQLARKLPRETRIVFVTAFDEYALQAFEAAAVDYLLKPVTAERLAVTLERLRSPDNPGREQLLSLLQEMKPARKDYLQWLRAGTGDTTELVDVADVVYFSADNKYTSAFTAENEYVLRMGISELEDKLDPATFWRIHRSAIVRVDQIKSARRDLRGRYKLTLRRRKEQLRTSARYAHLFRQM